MSTNIHNERIKNEYIPSYISETDFKCLKNKKNKKLF